MELVYSGCRGGVHSICTYIGVAELKLAVQVLMPPRSRKCDCL